MNHRSVTPTRRARCAHVAAMESYATGTQCLAMECNVSVYLISYFFVVKHTII